MTVVVGLDSDAPFTSPEISFDAVQYCFKWNYLDMLVGASLVLKVHILSLNTPPLLKNEKLFETA